MPNPQAPKTINLDAIRNQADRQMADAQTISLLCDGVNTLLAENAELKARLAALEAEAPTGKKTEPEKPTASIPGGL